MSGENTRSVGSWGETVAIEYLEARGLAFVQRNFTTRYGEIDVIMRDREVHRNAQREIIVFVEVKLRKDSSYARAREAVTQKKQRRMRITAELWLNANAPGAFSRFDVIEVYAPYGAMTRKPEVVHIQNAF